MDLCSCSYKNDSSRNWNYNTSFDDLPDGLMVDILSRLPVKTLVQSICVCKLWYSIIKTPSFISDHLSRSISNPSSYYIFLSHNYSPSVTVESSCYVDLIVERETDSINNGFGYSERVTNSINIGFGYSELEDDYKVLRIITECVYAKKVEIYSLKSGKWKALDVSIATEVMPCISPTFMHGCLYWHCVHLSQVDGHIQADEYLICFDLKDELFSRIELPKTYFRLNWTYHSGVFVKNGSLAIVLCTKDPESVLPFTSICVLMLGKKSGGQIRWEEFNYECANFNPRQCIGFGAMGLCCGGRLIFVANLDLLPEYVVAVDLNNSCAIERLALDFTDDLINEATNVSESLVLLSD